MTLHQARQILKRGAKLPQALEAICTLANHPDSTLADLMLGLGHEECVAEQAAIALSRRTGRTAPRGGALPRDPRDWLRYLAESHVQEHLSAAEVDNFKLRVAIEAARVLGMSSRTPERKPANGAARDARQSGPGVIDAGLARVRKARSSATTRSGHRPLRRVSAR